MSLGMIFDGSGSDFPGCLWGDDEILSSDADALYSASDGACYLIGDRLGDAGDLFYIDALFAVFSEERDDIFNRNIGDVSDIDGRVIHRDMPDDRSALSSHEDLSAIAESPRDTVVVSNRYGGDPVISAGPPCRPVANSSTVRDVLEEDNLTL